MKYSIFGDLFSLSKKVDNLANTTMDVTKVCLKKLNFVKLTLFQAAESLCGQKFDQLGRSATLNENRINQLIDERVNSICNCLNFDSN